MLLADQPTVLDEDDAVGKGDETRIMRHHQDAATVIAGDAGQNAHDGLTIAAVEGGGRLVRENGGRFGDDGPRDRDPLLFAAAQFQRIGAKLVRQADSLQCLSGLVARLHAMLAAHVERQLHVFHRGQGRK
jgi:hypothetical protein